MFIWKDSYSVHIDAIDEQHKKLLSIGQKAEDVLNDYSDDRYDQIIEIISEMKLYTIFHFGYEEKLFAKYHFPDTESHIREHHVFVDKLESIDLYAIDDDHETAIKDILSFIAQWIFKHIMHTDFNYSEFLIDAME